MANKITLDTITSSFASTSLFNTNFAAIKSELDDKVLYRDNPVGEANQMLNDLDMNSNDILNAQTVNTQGIILNGVGLVAGDLASVSAASTSYDNTTSGLTATDVQDAIDEVEGRVDTTESSLLKGLNHGKNLIINGDLSIWQRGTSQTTSDYGSIDRFSSVYSTSVATLSQQSFTVGQTDVPNNPTYFMRETLGTPYAGTSQFSLLKYKMEDVTITSGKEVTLTFWAKADAAKDVAVEFVQDFGTGGSPSASVTGLSVTTLSLTTTWALQTITFTPPSVSGKTLGTDGNSSLVLNIWFNAGSDHNARTNSLGTQTITFDSAQFQLEFGGSATQFEYVHPADQIARCLWYFERIEKATDTNALASGYNEDTLSSSVLLEFVPKRSLPAISVSDVSHFTVIFPGGNDTPTVITADDIGKSKARIVSTISGVTTGEGCLLRIGNANGYIDIDSELPI